MFVINIFVYNCCLCHVSCLHLGRKEKKEGREGKKEGGRKGRKEREGGKEGKVRKGKEGKGRKREGGKDLKNIPKKIKYDQLIKQVVVFCILVHKEKLNYSLISILFYIILFLMNLFIYLFLAALCLRCCARAFSSCSKQGLLFVAVHKLCIAVASLVVEQGL